MPTFAAMLRSAMRGCCSSVAAAFGRGLARFAALSALLACSLESQPVVAPQGIRSGEVTSEDASLASRDAAERADAAGGSGAAPAGDTLATDAASMTAPDAGAGSSDDASALDASAEHDGAASDMAPDAAPTPGADDAGNAGDASPQIEPTEDFGLSCGNALCPSVTLPALQCCTDATDVDARRARFADRCGLARTGQPGCLELEQPGVLDDSCPSLTPDGAAGQQPGCCTETGRCGTYDISDNLGCHENPEVDEPCGDVIDEQVACELAGVYALRIDVEVAWGGQEGALFDLTDDGRGTITIVAGIVIGDLDADNELTGRLTPCGVELPPFYSSVLCETYAPTFPTTIWDDGAAPQFQVTGRVQCTNPGCIITLDPVTTLLGIELEDADAAWPTAGQADDFRCPSGRGEDCYPDHDRDGKPGITVLLPGNRIVPGYGPCANSGFERRGAPLNANLFAILDGVVRTDRLHLGVRARLGGSGRFGDDCGVGGGNGIAEFVQSRAAGCMREAGTHNPFERAAGQNDPCSAAEALFMNQNLPIYDILRIGDRPASNLDLVDRSPSEGTRVGLTRIADAGGEVSCADVRAAFDSAQ